MKKKESPEAEKESSERWLLTYSDMITLLLALFIILYSMSTIDAKKTAKMAEQFATALGTGTSATAGHGGGTGTGTGGGTGAGKGTGTGTSAGGGSGTGHGSLPKDALEEVYGILQNYVDKNHLQDQIGLDDTDNYVRIHLKDKLMFVPDTATMLPESQPVLKEIQGAIAQVYSRVDHITISGNTADLGERTMASDQVSWRLSSERAVTVLTAMVGYGLQQDKLSIEGYAHFNPAASNNTPEGRAKNRRVEITIYKYPVTTAKPGSAASSATSSATSSAGSTPGSSASSTASK